eukprot:m.8426 g.8426  ORF g.8426 m.8426 type:complete len:1362 (-) comp5355_c0_seq1:4791-8876(-)
MRFAVLYTTQKRTKRKKYKDGTATFDGKLLKVYSESRSLLDTAIRTEVCVDDEFETDKLYIYVDAQLAEEDVGEVLDSAETASSSRSAFLSNNSLATAVANTGAAAGKMLAAGLRRPFRSVRKQPISDPPEDYSQPQAPASHTTHTTHSPYSHSDAAACNTARQPNLAQPSLYVQHSATSYIDQAPKPKQADTGHAAIGVGIFNGSYQQAHDDAPAEVTHYHEATLHVEQQTPTLPRRNYRLQPRTDDELLSILALLDSPPATPNESSAPVKSSKYAMFSASYTSKSAQSQSHSVTRQVRYDHVSAGTDAADDDLALEYDDGIQHSEHSTPGFKADTHGTLSHEADDELEDSDYVTLGGQVEHTSTSSRQRSTPRMPSTFNVASKQTQQTRPTSVSLPLAPDRPITLEFPRDSIPDVIERSAVIPKTFPNLQHYKRAITNAVLEQVLTSLLEVAQRFRLVSRNLDLSAYAPDPRRKVSKANSGPSCKHGVARYSTVKKAGANNGRGFYACAEQRSNQCKFFMWADKYMRDQASSGGQGSSILRPTSGAEIDRFYMSKGLRMYCECTLSQNKRSFRYPSSKSKTYFLSLSRRESSSSYGKGDVWVVSANLDFGDEVAICKSSYFGPNTDNELEIAHLSGCKLSSLLRKPTLFALHIGNFANELTCIENIEQHMFRDAFPVLPTLVDPTNPKPSYAPQPQLEMTFEAAEDICEQYIRRYKLNEDQAATLRRAVRMLPLRNKPEQLSAGSNVLLIHGVYGSGKSFLIGVLVRCLKHIFNEAHSDAHRVLVSSTTNVAVDRILLNLLDLGCTDFVRVGSAKKIAKSVLPYSTHGSASADKREIADLKDMLKDGLSSSERQDVLKTIEMLKRGDNRQRLEHAQVVGVTCAASNFPCLDGIQFPVVLLDECCQMSEPSALLPVARFRCGLLLLVGDPKQLSPTISGAPTKTRHGLEQTMFERLMLAGLDPIMLRTQYRCHPDISQASNQLFYNNHLRDGISRDQRGALVPSIPALAFFDVSAGREQRAADGSYMNQAECEFIAQLMQYLAHHDIDLASVGVIALYKAQAEAIETRLKTIEGASRATQISTVDAFQGGEKDIIILSCVRTGGIGFIDDAARINVAITRARRHLIILGKGQTLSSNTIWSQVLERVRHVDGLRSAALFAQQMQKEQEEAVVVSQEVDTTQSDEKMDETEIEAALTATILGPESEQQSPAAPAPKRPHRTSTSTVDHADDVAQNEEQQDMDSDSIDAIIAAAAGEFRTDHEGEHHAQSHGEAPQEKDWKQGVDLGEDNHNSIEPFDSLDEAGSPATQEQPASRRTYEQTRLELQLSPPSPEAMKLTWDTDDSDDGILPSVFTSRAATSQQ